MYITFYFSALKYTDVLIRQKMKLFLDALFLFLYGSVSFSGGVVQFVVTSLYIVLSVHMLFCIGKNILE